MLKHILLILLFVMSSFMLADDKIYTWIDEDGVVHYGDRPPAEVEAEEVAIQGKKKAPVVVDEAVLPGQWFGTDQSGGEVRFTLNENGNMTFVHTRADQSVFNFQGIWSFEDNSITVITEFTQTAPRNGDFQRSVEPLRLQYNIIGFSDTSMELIISDDRFDVSRI